jgi:hypothetical protein
MSNVLNVTISQLLQKLFRLEWQVPNFQRDFVWEMRDCAEFASSVLAGRPIGMVTVWYLDEGQQLALEPLQMQVATATSQFAVEGSAPQRRAAILDGRQRSQATAMVFGGFRSNDARSTLSNRFLLQTVSNKEDGEIDAARPKVVFVTLKAARERGLETPEGAIRQGYFPIDAFNAQVLRRSQAPSALDHYDTMRDIARDSATYGETGCPPDHELNRRLRIFREAMGNLGESKFAVYEVPSRFGLGEICEIFETLNTSGTRVSTVDLIHSWLAGDTANRSSGSILLRQWMDEIGSYPATGGWSVRKQRPELIVQMVAGTYLALGKDHRPEPRKVGNVGYGDSIRARDLLAIPTEHWSNIVESSEDFVECLAGMQDAVAGKGRRFSAKDCPYPAMTGIYMGLWWHHRARAKELSYGIQDVDALFRAFFWRNALTERYDQGMLTKFRADLVGLLEILACKSGMTPTAWCEAASTQLDSLVGEVPDEGSITERALDGSTAGAMRAALLLPMVAGARDLYTDAPLSAGAESLELHHIWPRKWCDQNRNGAFAAYLDSRSPSDPISSVANMMPLSRSSNLKWRADHPATAIETDGLAWETHEARWKRVEIDRDCFRYMTSDRGGGQIGKFWERRARGIAQRVVRLTGLHHV